ncbi:hypothetical protein [Embleya sp. MST-111070]|uniref:hypothetical protein n=1 Tax=Embleya sp. MST-111070 TaxID=3398231 RepID=UPI003F735DD9
MTSTEAAALALQDHAALWSAREIPAIDVVDAACVALVAGLDGPGLRILAACTRAEAVRDVHELLPVAFGQLGLAFYAFGGAVGKVAAVPALARRMLGGRLSPREFASRIHRHHGHELALTERLAQLDDEYDCLGVGARTAAEIDAEITAEARRLGRLIEPADGPG